MKPFRPPHAERRLQPRRGALQTALIALGFLLFFSVWSPARATQSTLVSANKLLGTGAGISVWDDIDQRTAAYKSGTYAPPVSTTSLPGSRYDDARPLAYEATAVPSPIVFKRLGTALFDSTSFPLEVSLDVASAMAVFRSVADALERQARMLANTTYPVAAATALHSLHDQLIAATAYIEELHDLLLWEETDDAAADAEDAKANLHSRLKRQLGRAIGAAVRRIRGISRPGGRSLGGFNRSPFGSTSTLHQLVGEGARQTTRFSLSTGARGFLSSTRSGLVNLAKAAPGYAWKQAKGSIGSLGGTLVAGGILYAIQASEEKEVWTAIDDVTTGINQTSDFVALLQNKSLAFMHEASTAMTLMAYTEVSLQLGHSAMRDATQLKSTLESLLANELPAALMLPRAWREAFLAVTKTTSLASHTMILSSPGELLRQPFSISSNNASMLITIDVPAVRHSNLMSLIEFVPLPLSAPTADGKLAVLAPTHKLLALAALDAQNEVTLFRAMEESDREACTAERSLLTCDNMRPARSAQQAQQLPSADRCLLALFAGDNSGIRDACPVALVPPYDDIVPVDDSTAILVAATPDTAHVACDDGSHHRLEIAQGCTRIDLRPDCSITSRAGRFYSAAHPPETRAIQVAAPDWISDLQRTLRDTANTAFPPPSLQAPRLQHDFSRVHRLVEEHLAAGRKKIGYMVGVILLGLLLVSGAVWSICCCCARRLLLPCARSLSYSPAATEDQPQEDLVTAVYKATDHACGSPETLHSAAEPWPEEDRDTAVPNPPQRAPRH